jgi:DNA-binding transcriptional ArsR family regulator
MKDGPDFARLGALIGDPARANILTALMAGRALTAGECATEAGIAASTASTHLAQLVEASLLAVEVQGRHRYYRIISPDVAMAVESLMGLAVRVGVSRTRPGPRDPAMRRARFCYDHLAGEVATSLFARLFSNGLIAAQAEGLVLTPRGRSRFIAEGIDIDSLESRQRSVCRACLDWSERKNHLAGGLGAAIAQLAIKRGWCRRLPASRIVSFAPRGETALFKIAEGSEAGVQDPAV